MKKYMCIAHQIYIDLIKEINNGEKKNIYMTSDWISVMQKSTAKLSDGITEQRFTEQLL